MNDLYKLKQEYNHNLERLYNGEKYCQEHIDEIDKWYPEFKKIFDRLNYVLEEIEKQYKPTKKEISEGFEL